MPDGSLVTDRTTKRRSRKIEGTCTADQAAAFDFAGLPDVGDDEAFSTTVAIEKMRTFWPSLRMASLMLTKSKDELVAMCRKEPEAFAHFLDCLPDQRDFYKNIAEILEALNARLLIAGSSVAIEGDAA